MNLELGHQHGTEAEELLEKGDMEGAIKAHYMAAEYYLQAINDASDPEVVKTLKLLYTNHMRQSKELSRRKSHSEVTKEPSPTKPSESLINTTTTTTNTSTTATATTSTLIESEKLSTLDMKKDLDPLLEFSRHDDFDNFWDNVEALARSSYHRPNLRNSIGRFSAASEESTSTTFNEYNEVETGTQRSSSPVKIDLDHSRLRMETKTLEEYREENMNLKQTVNEMSIRLNELEKENQLLRRALLRLRNKQ